MPIAMKGSRTARAGVGLAVAAAIVGGTLVARDQLTGGASVQTLSDRNGTLQGLVHTGTPKGHPLVAFLGPFALHRKGVQECGPAVRFMEGALRRKKFRKAPARNCIGPATVKQIKAFQTAIHYKPTGIYSLVTHRALVLRGGYTQQARRDLVYLAHKVLLTRERHNVVIIAAHARLVGGNTLSYSQSGSRSSFPAWPRLPPATDCSGFITWIAYQAGFGASVGYYGPGSPVGWTGTLNYQGFLVRPNQALAIGDIVLYPSSSASGPPWGHVAMYIGHGLVVSHGSVGVRVLPFNYRPVGAIRRLIA